MSCYSKTKEGKNNPFYGMKHSAKTRLLMKLKGKGKNTGGRIKINPYEYKICNGCGEKIYRRRILNWEWTHAKKYCSSICYKNSLKGKGNPMYGKISANNKGGTSTLLKKLRDHMFYREWRRIVLNTNPPKCEYCSSTKMLQAHHKIPFAKIVNGNSIKSVSDAESCKELWDITNGLVLCKGCHNSLHLDYESDSFTITLKKNKKFDRTVNIRETNVLISKDTYIGKGAKIERNSILEGCIIGKNCTIMAFSFIQKKVKLKDHVIIGSHTLIRKFTIIGRNSKIGSHCTIEPYTQIGYNTSIQTMNVISEFSDIGNGVFIAPHFCNPSDNSIGDVEREEYKPNPAKIEDNVRIGTNVTLKPGITIKKGAVIGIGSVVCNDVEEGEVWYGEKAKCRKR